MLAAGAADIARVRPEQGIAEQQPFPTSFPRKRESILISLESG
jgi:hypothetical protein